jgi:hypothetical protein
MLKTAQALPVASSFLHDKQKNLLKAIQLMKQQNRRASSLKSPSRKPIAPSNSPPTLISESRSLVLISE